MSVNPWAVVPEELELPSGNTVKVKRTPMQTLIRTGAINQSLLAAMTGDSDDPKANLELMAIIATHTLVEPKVTLDPKKVKADVLSVDVIPDEDLGALFAWANGTDLASEDDDASFRGQPTSTGTGEDSEVLGDDA